MSYLEYLKKNYLYAFIMCAAFIIIGPIADMQYNFEITWLTPLISGFFLGIVVLIYFNGKKGYKTYLEVEAKLKENE